MRERDSFVSTELTIFGLPVKVKWRSVPITINSETLCHIRSQFANHRLRLLKRSTKNEINRKSYAIPMSVLLLSLTTLVHWMSEPLKSLSLSHSVVLMSNHIIETEFNFKSSADYQSLPLLIFRHLLGLKMITFKRSTVFLRSGHDQFAENQFAENQFVEIQLAEISTKFSRTEFRWTNFQRTDFRWTDRVALRS